MDHSTELRRVVYNVLLTQIHFGVYHYQEKLPSIEETSSQLCVSIDTARAAYLKLKEEGYITLAKNVGATVKVEYSDQKIEEFIQTFFSSRKKAMADLGNSLKPLFGNAQWNGLKNASPETVEAMEQLYRRESATATYAMLEHYRQKYCSLGNSLLMRLVWQSFMFLQDPFFCIEENLRAFDQYQDYLPRIVSLCRSGDWSGLRAEVEQSIDKLSASLFRFYDTRITMPSPENELVFTWSSYKKSRQLCYSLAMELLLSISRGKYPVGSLLPSQKELAMQKGVSVSTVRRALELLGSVGAIKSAKYVGTEVLPIEKTTENCNFAKPVLRRRLLDMAESLQILALSCKAVSLLTLSSLGPGEIRLLSDELKANKRRRRGETLSYFALSQLAEHAPYQAVRTVYSELLRQFFWAYALRGLDERQETLNAIYAPYSDALIHSLETTDYSRFSTVLEELLIYDFRKIVGSMSMLGIAGAEKLLVPDRT